MIQAVVGAQFGDEGKGLLVDALATPSTLVVRHNGGAQAGHTVVTPDGRRHAFRHVGAGALRGAATLLSRFFVVNPVVFADEILALAERRVEPTVYVDWRAPVTTPFDVMLNVAAERARGPGRHGSCGLGVNETVTRQAEQPLVADDLTRSPAALRAILRRIKDDYVPRRCAALEITPPSELETAGLIDAFVGDCRAFVGRTLQVDDALRLAAHDGDLLFEGAQGLGLDERAPWFPHVTRSRPGLPNVAALLREAKREEPVHVHYVTRCYVTRHGAGPLSNEVDGHPYGWTGPETNVANAHQGPLRYARMNTLVLAAHVAADLASAAGTDRRPSLFVTCLDQTAGAFGVREAADLAARVGLLLHGTAHGPTRVDIDYALQEA